MFYIPRQMRLSKHLLKHPGTWILGALIAIGVGILFPVIAPAMVILAGVLMPFAVIAFAFYVMNFLGLDFVGPKQLELYETVSGYNGYEKQSDPNDFFKHHRWQYIVIGITTVAFIVALALTIGFFTGGAGFAFMAPVFSAISAPFAMAAAAAHISLSMPALAGFCFVMMPLVIGNHLKRFLAWLDSFKYDALEANNNYREQLNDIDLRLGTDRGDTMKKLRTCESNLENDYKNYLGVLKIGMRATYDNNFSSPHEDRKDSYKALHKKEKITKAPETQFDKNKTTNHYFKDAYIFVK